MDGESRKIQDKLLFIKDIWKLRGQLISIFAEGVAL